MNNAYTSPKDAAVSLSKTVAEAIRGVEESIRIVKLARTTKPLP